jgi:hypothetical protein
MGFAGERDREGAMMSQEPGLTGWGKADRLAGLQGVSRVDIIAERRAGGRVFVVAPT